MLRTGLARGLNQFWLTDFGRFSKTFLVPYSEGEEGVALSILDRRMAEQNS